MQAERSTSVLQRKKNNQKKLKKAETAHWILSDLRDQIFAGSLVLYKKDDLQALALALQLSDNSTKDNLKTCISEMFENDPNLKQNPWFFGLFNKSHCQVNGLNNRNDPAITEDRYTKTIPAQSCDDPPVIPSPVPASSSHSMAPQPPLVATFPSPHCPVSFPHLAARPFNGNPTYYYPYPTSFNSSHNGNHHSTTHSPYNPYYTFQIPTNHTHHS